MPLIQKTIAFLLNTYFWKSIIRLTPRLYGYPKFKLENYFVIRKILRENPNDIFCFVGCDNHSVALIMQRKLYGIHWGHSGFLELGEDNEIYISHVRRKIRYDSLLYYLKEIDNLAVIKFHLSEDEKILARQKIAKLKKSKVTYLVKDPLEKTGQYASPDTWKELDEFHFYCSEYQYYVFRGMNHPLFSYGRNRFSTDDLYKSGTIVFEG